MALLSTFSLGSTLQAQSSLPEASSDVSTETSQPQPQSEETSGETTDAPEEAVSRFTCQLNNGQYTVMYAPSSQPGQMYPWAIPQDMGSAWPAQRRCQEISARLESYRPDGLLSLNTGVENGYNIVCVTTEAVPTCRIVFTVPEGQDPALTRDQVFNTLASADQGLATEGVNTFAPTGNSSLGQIGDLLRLPGSLPALSSRQSINLKPFLAPSDGGTGTALTGGRATTPGRSLNPNNFR
ncbi:MAG TPA: hypothetical protein IGR64_13310 [Leptolyngbyaceae cyanobacterium M65_K2018_010]|nr:hypothetical protein [Leptolyngbyaceae cyanobacterium M65_K2018_010]